MNESLEELKAIIDNAPTDATHACIENGTHYQFKVVGLNAEINTGDGWLCYSGCALPDLYGVRLISDIKRIIELEEKLKSFADDISDCNCIGGVSKTLREYGL